MRSRALDMKSVAAGKFKDRCLRMLNEVEANRTPVIITKRGRPVAKLVPYVRSAATVSLANSVVRETGDPYGTGETWNDGAS